MTIGRVVWRGTRAAIALAAVVTGLTWLNRVSSAVMEVGGSCSSGGPYEVATPCPGGAWMAPVGLFLGLAGLGLYLLWRPAGSPQLLLFTWPALFGSLGIQFLRAAAAETDAYGFWLCGVLFLVMAAAPLALVMTGDPAALRRAVLGDGLAEPDRTVPPSTGSSIRPPPMVPVTLAADHDAEALAESLDRLSRLHRNGDLSAAEFAEAKQKVLDGA